MENIIFKKLNKNYTTIKVFFIFLSIILFLVQSQPVFALELQYPNIDPLGIFNVPNLNDPSLNNGQGPLLPEFIYYWFVFAIVVAGAIGVLQIVFSGIRIILSAGNPAAMGEAKERILNSILGIVLLMSSVIILRTINPNFINPVQSILPRKEGVYFTDGSNYKQAPSSVADLDAIDLSEMQLDNINLVYFCNGNDKHMLLWLYSGTNFNRAGDDDASDTIVLPCSTPQSPNPISLSGSEYLSYRYQPLDTGVYYYRTENCTGLATCASSDSCAQKTDGDIPNFDTNDNFNNQVNSFRIITNGQNKTYVVLTKKYNNKGECSEPYPYTTDSNGNLNYVFDDGTIGSLTGGNLQSGFRGVCVGNNPSTIVPLKKDLNGNDFNPYSVYIKQEAPIYPNSHVVYLFSNHLYVELSKNEIGYHYTYPNQQSSSITTLRCDPKTRQCVNDPNGTATDCNAAGDTCTPSDDDSNLDNLLSRPPADVIQGTWTADDAPPAECTAADQDNNGNRRVCINKIESNSNFNIILYAQAQKVAANGSIERSCKIFANGLNNTNKDIPDEDFVDLIGYSKDDNTYLKYIYRMDIIPYTY